MRTCEASSCIFPVWGTDRITGKGYCKTHQYLRSDRDTRTIFQKHMAKAKTVTEAKLTDLQKWYIHFMLVSEPRCAECGMYAEWVKQPGYEKVWRACQAHLLPKKKEYGFQSLSTNYDNHIVLFPAWGGHLCGDHGLFDSSWFNASRMHIWPSVIETFKTKLYPLIPENELKNIPEQLLVKL